MATTVIARPGGAPRGQRRRERRADALSPPSPARRTIHRSSQQCIATSTDCKAGNTILKVRDEDMLSLDLFRRSASRVGLCFNCSRYCSSARLARRCNSSMPVFHPGLPIRCVDPRVGHGVRRVFDRLDLPNRGPAAPRRAALAPSLQPLDQSATSCTYAPCPGNELARSCCRH
jgi:hypothetical protein